MNGDGYRQLRLRYGSQDNANKHTSATMLPQSARDQLCSAQWNKKCMCSIEQDGVGGASAHLLNCLCVFHQWLSTDEVRVPATPGGREAADSPDKAARPPLAYEKSGARGA